MKLTFIFFMTLTLVSGALAQTQGPIAIGILTIAGPRRTLANNITALLNVNLSSDSHFTVLERSQLDSILKELALGRSGMITPETAAKIGHLTGAKILVTGREFNAGGNNNIVVIGNAVGVETGRIFSRTVQGSATNLVALISDLSGQLDQVILEQSTNLLAETSNSVAPTLDIIIEQTSRKPQPSILIQIGEDIPGGSHSAQTELGAVFEKAGFTVMDETSKQVPDILLTGDAMAVTDDPQGGLFSGHATLEIKAQQRRTGKILALDLQRGAAVDISPQTAKALALKNAADALAQRLLPVLAR